MSLALLMLYHATSCHEWEFVKYTVARCSWYKYFGTDAMKRSLMDVRHDDAGQDVFGFGEKGHG